MAADHRRRSGRQRAHLRGLAAARRSRGARRHRRRAHRHRVGGRRRDDRPGVRVQATIVRWSWERRSDAVFRELAQDPATGVRIVRGRLFGAPELGPGLPPGIEERAGLSRRARAVEPAAEVSVSGFGAELPFADMPRYLAWLVGRVTELGGTIEQRVVTDLAAVDPHAEYVINCSGPRRRAARRR